MTSSGPPSPRRARALFALRYAAFAVVTGAANLVVQAAVVGAAPGLPVMASIVAGTGFGFALKYLLDKRFIFADPYLDAASEARKIAGYGLAGVVTTALFWTVELTAFALTGTEAGRFGGAVVGLALGSWLKYRLDRRFVFRGGAAEPADAPLGAPFGGDALRIR